MGERLSKELDELTSALLESVAELVAAREQGAALRVTDSPYLEAHAARHDGAATVVISRGLVYRTALLFHILGRARAERLEGGPRLFTATISTVLDLYLLDPPTPKELFPYAPEVVDLLSDHNNLRPDEAWAAFHELPSAFALKREQGLLPLPDLDQPISIKTRAEIAVAIRFIALHELVHLNKHRAHFGGAGEFRAHPLFPSRTQPPKDPSSVAPGARKALEIDADATAAEELVNQALTGFVLDPASTISEVLAPIYVVLSLLDIAGTSLLSFHDEYITHPMPDVRAHGIYAVLRERLGNDRDALGGTLLTAHERAIKSVVRSFQFVGMTRPPMVMTACELVCMQTNFIATMVATALLQAELWRVEADHRSLFGGARHNSWTINPFGYSRQRYAIAARSELQRLMSVSSQPTDEEAKETLVAAFKALRRNVREGDRLLIDNDHTISSPVGALPVAQTESGMKVVQYGMVVTDGKFEAIFDDVSSPKVRFINEAQNLAMSMLSAAANIKVVFD